ncbi:MAG: hypothetical protein CME36_02080 [unclassified Hahellaceae]|nr:hypothetical protein [Hahellaceae bacterium]|tara:strand:- start:16935 stop:17708 length:774 start_codon:yes stop_codon:yes gene_type:complete
MMKVTTPLIVLLLGLAACTSVEPREPARSAEAEMAVQLVRNAERRNDELSRADLVKALGVFEAVDDRSGRWSALHALAAWHMAQRDRTTALAFAQQAFDLASQLDSKASLYSSALQLGQLSGNDNLFREALSYAQPGLGKAVLHVLLKEYEAAKAELATHRASAGEAERYGSEEAFVLYHLGKHEGDRHLVLEALDSYRLAGDAYGVTDSLFVVARLEESPDVALEFAKRALLAARQTGDENRIAAISHWLESKGSE